MILGTRIGSPKHANKKKKILSITTSSMTTIEDVLQIDVDHYIKDMTNSSQI